MYYRENKCSITNQNDFTCQILDWQTNKDIINEDSECSDDIPQYEIHLFGITLNKQSVHIKVINNKTNFSNKYKKDQILKINIAHNEGNFFTDTRHLEELKKDNLIAFKYCDENGDINEKINPNGSLENIAGIFNSKKNILGMMPHPERMVDEIISNNDGINLFSSLLN